MTKQMLTVMLTVAMLSAGMAASSWRDDDGNRVLTIDHYVRLKSSVPSIAGQDAQIFVRERTKAATVLRGSSVAGRTAIFVHGAGTPGHVAFDVPHSDYSWMAYLANAGFDVFSLDFSGY